MTQGSNKELIYEKTNIVKVNQHFIVDASAGKYIFVYRIFPNS